MISTEAEAASSSPYATRVEPREEGRLMEEGKSLILMYYLRRGVPRNQSQIKRLLYCKEVVINILASGTTAQQKHKEFGCGVASCPSGGAQGLD